MIILVLLIVFAVIFSFTKEGSTASGCLEAIFWFILATIISISYVESVNNF